MVGWHNARDEESGETVLLYSKCRTVYAVGIFKIAKPIKPQP